MQVLPFDYYYEQFHFCQPPDLTPMSESLGSILFGDRLYSSPINVCIAMAS